MVRRPLLRVATIGLSMLAAVAGCSGGPGGPGGSGRGERSGATADEWAARVCGALAPWRKQITDLNAQTQRQITASSTPEQAKSHLLELLAGGQTASEAARAAVVAAGMPDVEGGDEVADRFTATLAGARDAYTHAHGDLQALPVQDAKAFYDGVVAVLTRLNQEYTAGGLDPSRLESRELRRAFDGALQCR